MSSPKAAPKQIVVLIDFQNLYRSARDAYCWKDRAGQFGNVGPLQFGRMISEKCGGELLQVRIYTGVHSTRGNAVQHGAMMRRMKGWLAAAAHQPSLVKVFPRTLAYRGKQVQEKGIDVKLAVDMVALSLNPRVDHLALISADTDLKPAVEFVLEHTTKTVTCVGLEPNEDAYDSPRALTFHHDRASRYEIPQSEFDRVADRVNYYDEASVDGLRVSQADWLRIQRDLGASSQGGH